MRKSNFLILLLSILSLYNVNGQLESDSFIQDFTAQDINGEEWNLYSLLDNGKNVILHITPTYSDPGWYFHKTGVLQELHSLYGPEGTDELYVFLIERDEETGPDQLLGEGWTEGNWVEGTDFPIIDDHVLADDLQAQNYQTIYFICPNKIIQNVEIFTIDQYEDFIAHCPIFIGENNIGLRAYEGDSGFFCEDYEAGGVIQFMNTGSNNLTETNFDLYINDNLFDSKTWFGDLAMGETEEIEFLPFVQSESAKISFIATLPNTVNDENPIDNTIDVYFSETYDLDENYLTLEIKMDDYASETSWSLSEKGGPVYFRGGSISDYGKSSDYENGKTYTEQLPLPKDGCYQFIIEDTASDGICCGWGDGNYKLLDTDDNVLSEGGDYDLNEISDIQIKSGDVFLDTAAIIDYIGEPTLFCKESELEAKLVFRNIGANEIQTAELELHLNDQILTESWAGSLFPGEFTEISFGNQLLDTTTKVIYSIGSINGKEDLEPYKNNWEIQYDRNETNEQELKLQIQLDQYAYEIYWEVTNSAGDQIAFGGNELVGPDGGGLQVADENDPGAYFPNQPVTEYFTIPPGTDDCYYLHIVDDWGDGTTLGSYAKVSDLNGNQVLYKDIGAYRWANDSTIFTVQTPVSSLDNDSFENYSIFPNPTSNNLKVTFEKPTEFKHSIQIYNNLGQLVLKPKIINNIENKVFDFSVSSLKTGVYYVNFSGYNFSFLKI